MKQIIKSEQATIQNLATQLISLALKYHALPWRNPVRRDSENCGLPLDVATQESFDPVSTLLLQIVSKQKHFSSRWWGTTNAWKELGGHVRHNETSTWIAVPNKEDAYVFNVEQVDGEDVGPFRPVDGAVIEAGEVDQISFRQVMVKMGCEESGFVSDGRSDLLSNLVQWADLRIDGEAELPLREMATEICAGWLATESSCPLVLSQSLDEDVLETWLREMHQDPAWIFRVCERAKGMVERILRV